MLSNSLKVSEDQLMKKNILLSVAIFLLVGSALQAQSNLGGQFLEGYHFGYRLNPAVTPDTDIRSGFLNTLGVKTRSNIGFNSFFFPVDGRVATGLNRHVPAEDFLGGLQEENTVIGAAEVGLFARGFQRGGIYHTIDINVRSNDLAVLPYDLMEFLKKGSEGKEVYDLSAFHINSSNYLELAYGMAWKTERFRFGLRMKPLFGFSRLESHFDAFQIDLADPDNWRINARAQIEIAGNQFSSKTRGEENEKVFDPGSFDFNLFRPAIAGVGFAADFGIQWKANEFLDLGASVLDIGMIGWFNKLCARTPEVTAEYAPVAESEADSKDSSRNLFDIAKFYVRENNNSFVRIPMIVSATAKMKMPFYERLALAVSGQIRNSPDYTVVEGRFHTIWSPWSWFSATVNVGRDKYGWAGGAAANFTTKEFNFFVGTDSYIFRVTPQMIPVGRANASITFGISHAL